MTFHSHTSTHAHVIFLWPCDLPPTLCNMWSTHRGEDLDVMTWLTFLHCVCLHMRVLKPLVLALPWDLVISRHVPTHPHTHTHLLSYATALSVKRHNQMNLSILLLVTQRPDTHYTHTQTKQTLQSWQWWHLDALLLWLIIQNEVTKSIPGFTSHTLPPFPAV